MLTTLQVIHALHYTPVNLVYTCGIAQIICTVIFGINLFYLLLVIALNKLPVTEKCEKNIIGYSTV